jgi:hypothetical protein
MFLSAPTKTSTPVDPVSDPKNLPVKKCPNPQDEQNLRRLTKSEPNPKFWVEQFVKAFGREFAKSLLPKK